MRNHKPLKELMKTIQRLCLEGHTEKSLYSHMFQRVDKCLKLMKPEDSVLRMDSLYEVMHIKDDIRAGNLDHALVGIANVLNLVNLEEQGLL